MQYAESILDLVGDTPLVRISRLTGDLGPADRQPLLLAKLEMLNPGGSVKDRIGLPMIEAAERARPAQAGRDDHRADIGQHRPRRSPSPPRSRATAASSSWPTSNRPRSSSSCGPTARRSSCARPTSRPSPRVATTRWRRGLPATSPARSSPTSTGTRRTRPPTSGRPVRSCWDQTDGRISHFVASVGTGGTISGAARVLKARNPAIQVIGADPEGSVLSGDTARPYLTEGVGEDFVPGTYDPSVIDRWVRVSDRDAFAMARRLTREEGILAGGSCGTAMVAALQVVGELAGTTAGRDAVVVVLLPDSGRSYLSKIYNDEWMRANGLLATTGAVIRVDDLLNDRHHAGLLPDLVIARTTQRVGEAIAIAPGVLDQPAAGLGATGERRARGHRRLDHGEGPSRPGLP